MDTTAVERYSLSVYCPGFESLTNEDRVRFQELAAEAVLRESRSFVADDE